MKTKPTFRLKHLAELLSPQPDYPKVMTEVCGYNNNWLGRKWVFVWKFRQAYRLIKEYQDVHPRKVEENPNCPIKRPKSIDHITFIAMLDIQSLLSNAGEKNDITGLFIDLITKSCYSANNEDE